MRTVSACIGKVSHATHSSAGDVLSFLQERDGSTIILMRDNTEADEAYVIGKRGQYTPVGAYLAGDEIIKIALEHGAQMIHPGGSHY